MNEKTALIVAILSLTTAACIIVPKICPNTMESMFSKTEIENLRFQTVYNKNMG